MGDGQKANIYTIPVKGGAARQLTFFNSFNYSPAWSPDGEEIVFGSNEGGKYQVWRINQAGGQPSLFTKSDLSKDAMRVVWAPGQEILYQRPGNRNFHFLDPQTEIETQFVSNDSVGWMLNPCLSPDRQRIAIFWNRRDVGRLKRGIWIISLQDSSQEYISKKNFSPISWTKDGSEIFGYDYNQPDKVYRFNVRTGEAMLFETFSFSEVGQPDISDDGNTIIVPEITKNSDIWLMENFDPEVE
jgi:Tol biopolymer transport system component